MRIVFSFCLLFIVSLSNAQEQHRYFNEISYDYGIFSSLNPREKPGLNGEIMKLNYTHFYNQKFGFQTGINVINYLEGSDIVYTLPLYFKYRSPINNNTYINLDGDTFGEVIFNLIIGLLPRQSEFYAGFNLGYLEPNNSIVISNTYGEIYSYFDSEQRFFFTIDLGLSLKYRIRRIGISINPTLSYLLSKNFKYYSEDFADGYSPKLFMNGTVGISYNF